MKKSVLAVLLAMSLFLPGLLPATAQAQEASNPCREYGTPVASPGATPTIASESQSVELENGEALLWPAGDRGVLLLHGAVYDAASWEPQASVLATEGYTVLSLETLSSEAVLEGIEFLIGECGVIGVTVVGASAGGASALDALGNDPQGVAGLILLSATGEVDALGDYPKLFVASEEESFADQLETMTENAPGEENDTLILPGAAHAQAIFKSNQGDALIKAILSFLKDNAAWDSE